MIQNTRNLERWLEPEAGRGASRRTFREEKEEAGGGAIDKVIDDIKNL
ncbi:MAG: hypothetical protein HYW38_01865 [Candidatus Colwellbacteria bacterium]|nr:hypothetical protein [Candidatus Colwellbacteria bacterium]